MFTIDNNLQDLRVKERNIFKILYSMNSHPVATPEMSVEEARCYILFFSEGQNLSAFIGLYLPAKDRRFFYAYATNPFPFEAADDVEDEARQFAEDMGFLLDEINVSGMPADDRDHWIEDQFIFGYKKPEIPRQVEEPEDIEEVEEEDEEEGAEEEEEEEKEEEEEPETIEVPAPKTAVKEVRPSAKEMPPVKEEKQEPPAAPAPPMPEPPPQSPPAYPQQQYPGYPQPGQPYQPSPYQGYPPPGPPYQGYPPPGQPYPGYPPPGQPYQPYPGYPQQMPPQYPPAEPPPELEIPDLEEEQAPPARSQPAVKKNSSSSKAQPAVQRRQVRGEDERMHGSGQDQKSARPRNLTADTSRATAKQGAHRTPASQGPGGTVTRDKEALARLLSSF